MEIYWQFLIYLFFGHNSKPSFCCVQNFLGEPNFHCQSLEWWVKKEWIGTFIYPLKMDFEGVKHSALENGIRWL